MTVTTRFAPSPTGHLHIGNIRTALHNWMWAKKNGGRFILRIDDTDKERSKEEYVDCIRADLDWLGLNPDHECRQSDRCDRYEEEFQRLLADGRVYPCYETPQELELKRKVQLGRGLPPIYDRSALQLSDEQKKAYDDEGRTPHWRFLLDHDSPIAWNDLIRGEQCFEASQLSDPVIRRGDGSWLYMLPSAIDDLDMGISHVVRGEDHVSNTAAQLQMCLALGGRHPEFAHEALLVGAEGKLSKRLGSLGVKAFRETGIEPCAIISLLARLGTSDPVVAVHGRDELLETFDFARFGRAPARFALEDLARLNAQLVHDMPYDMVSDRLPDAITAEIWETIRPNITHLGEAESWYQVIERQVVPPELEAGDAEFLAIAKEMLAAQDTPWPDDIWQVWTKALKDETGRKGRGLFLPLRRALTGMDQGPDMSALLPLIGRERALARLGQV